MTKHGLLIDIDYCVGCQSCTVACKQEHGYDADTWGIRVTEHVYTLPSGKVQVDYVPFPTELCTLCAARISSGFDDKPSCVKHCMAKCISYGEITELAKKMLEKPRQILHAPK